MSDYMKEAERLLDEMRTCALAEATHYASPDFKRAKASEEAANSARSALLAHIQRGCYPQAEIMDNNGRGAVPEGWQLVPKAPTEEMLLSGMGDDWPEDVYLRDAYELMLAAAPAPDHFRDAAEMVPMPDTTDIAGYTPQALRDYGDAREAAGYARGLKEAGRDGYASGYNDGIRTAALRGEVKP